MGAQTLESCSHARAISNSSESKSWLCPVEYHFFTGRRERNLSYLGRFLTGGGQGLCENLI